MKTSNGTNARSPTKEDEQVVAVLEDGKMDNIQGKGEGQQNKAGLQFPAGVLFHLFLYSVWLVIRRSFGINTIPASPVPGNPKIRR